MRNLWKPGLVILALLCTLYIPELCAQQITFSNATELLTERQKGSPICKGFADVNGDFRDDLIRAANGSELMVDINSNNGEFFQNIVLDTTEGSTWAILVGDLDNNGRMDLMSAGANNGFKIYEAGQDFGEFNFRQLSETDYFAQGANYVDINNDGWLDAFICDDDAESEVYINDGTGQLVRDTNLIDMKTTPVSDNSGNYASEWVDIDGDKDLDFYIAKCRLGVDDGIIESTDPRRINMLFINELNEGGTFREASEEWGVKIGRQTWTCNFGDIDNDGDQDLFLANHEAPCQLFENINGERFEEIPLFENGEDLELFAFQSSIADFNNDGFLDILLVGDGEQLLYNNGNKTFTSSVSPFGPFSPFSFALGDINEDGYIDAFASYRSLGPGETGADDELWINSGGPNNYFALSLVGRESNINGVGARVTIEGAWGQQYRVIQSGVGYGITNSLTARFGLGQADQIDRVSIEWPSGLMESFEGPEITINDHFIATEGECIQSLVTAEATGTRLDCTLSGTILSVDDDFDNIAWEPFGGNTAEIEVDTPGAYQAFVTRDGCENVSQIILVRGAEVLEAPILNVENDIVLCEGTSVELEVLNSEAFEWSTGDNTDALQISNSGSFFASSSSACDTIPSDLVQVTFVSPGESGEPIEEMFTGAQAVELQGPNESTTWYSDPDGLNQIGSGDIFLTEVLDADTTFYFDNDINLAPPGYLGGAPVTSTEENTDFSFENVNGALLFVTNEPCMFRSVKVNARVEGPRHIQIFNFITQELVIETTVDVPAGISEVFLNFPLESASYRMEVNPDSSTATFGSNNPELAIITGELDFPYRVSDLATISRSLFGREFYHYFFDFKMEPLVESCRTGITPYNLLFNQSSVNDVLDFNLELYPNPVSENLTIVSEKNINTINVVDNSGRTLMSKAFNSHNVNLDVSDLEQGTYLIELRGDDFHTIRQIVKMK